MKVIVLCLLVIYVALASARKCNPNCIKSYEPVCGGPEGGPYATFGNSCEYDFANCANGNEFGILSQGECKNECEEVACTAIYSPVCAGPNGGPYTTYSNKCVFYTVDCKKRYQDFIIYAREC